jgi:pilus assembly protein CpaE
LSRPLFGDRVRRVNGNVSRRLRIPLPDERGQASVELVGVLPCAVLAALVAWQLVLAGHALWMSSQAARVAARAHAVGRDPEAAARSALPRSLERSLSVHRRREGGVQVELRVPLVLRRLSSPVRVSATSSFGGQR